jgi:hypothetical protein
MFDYLLLKREAAATVTTLTLPVPAQVSARESDHDAARGGVPGPDVTLVPVRVCVGVRVCVCVAACTAWHRCLVEVQINTYMHISG